MCKMFMDWKEGIFPFYNNPESLKAFKFLLIKKKKKKKEDESSLPNKSEICTIVLIWN